MTLSGDDRSSVLSCEKGSRTLTHSDSGWHSCRWGGPLSRIQLKMTMSTEVESKDAGNTQLGGTGHHAGRLMGTPSSIFCALERI